jgi:hypothetical protein
MPWKIEENYKHCRGYAVVKQPDGSISGCHTTLDSAQAQMRALYSSEGEMGKEVLTNENVPNKNPQSLNPEDEEEKKKKIRVNVVKENGMDHENPTNPEWHGQDLYEMLPQDEKELADSLLALSEKVGPLDKAEGIWVGYVGPERNDNLSIGIKCGNCALHKNENQCVILSMPIEEEGNCRFAVIPQQLVNTNNISEEDMEDNLTMKATTLEQLDLKPTESMANNARRGLELRRKFGRGGTAVGVARARDLSNRKELSPETVARMYSFFSRHEVDKKGKDFNNAERPSNGKIAWLLWGGDSGYAWSRSKWSSIQRIRGNKMNKVWQGSAFSLNKHIDKSL